MPSFNFSGSNKTSFCKIEGPHAPHIIDSYKTVCHGTLDEFCTGRSGNGITITIDSVRPGSAEYPATARGNITTHGGYRPGSGRKPTGRTRRTFQLTDTEYAKLKELLSKIREGRN